MPADRTSGRHGLVKFGYYARGMSATRLMILGLVQWMQPVHGYDVKRELERWEADEWASIAPGSIYPALGHDLPAPPG